MQLQIISQGHEKHAALLKRTIEKRIPVEYVESGMKIVLDIDETIEHAESYVIKKEDGYYITGSDEAGLYYGIGKFLHTAKWYEDSFVPNPPQGVQSPDCSFRATYYSVHFYNWYHMSPTEELKEYVEEMLLWGYNAIVCIIPLLNFNSCDEPAFHAAVAKVRGIFLLCREVGMKVGIIINPNQGLKTTPKEFIADESCYDNRPGGKAGKNICQTITGAMEYMKYLWVMQLKNFQDIGLDYFLTWPYDEGGCGCKECAPWGANGYPTIVRKVIKEAKRFYPNATTIASTWFFDDPVNDGEYEGFYRRLREDLKDDVDYIMVDAHGSYPRYPLEHDIIKPIVNFPEISMYGLSPWGGRGANPLLKRFQGIWDESKHVLSGGMPYSEGKYEDISKVQFAGYYWDKDRSYQDIMAEYINYEYSDEVIDDVIEMMELIEENHVRVASMSDPNMEAARRSWELAQKVDAVLPEKKRTSWRWRILYIRSRVDIEVYEYYDKIGRNEEEGIYKCRRTWADWMDDNEEIQDLYQELCSYYHCVSENGENRFTRPRVKDGIVIPRG